MKAWEVAALAAMAGPAMAQNVDAKPMDYATLMAMPVPVIAGDITDHPYHVIGPIKTDVRKTTAFSHSPSDDKMRRELWERGKKMGADAVINAKLGDSHVTGFSWGAATARGEAIKFVEK